MKNTKTSTNTKHFYVKTLNTSLVAGFITSNVSPFRAHNHFPPIKHFSLNSVGKRNPIFDIIL